MAEAEQSHPPLTPARVAVGVALTAVAGYVDCFGYLTLSHVYTAQMSGNTVLIAAQGGHGQATSALVHAFTLGVFMLGLLVTGVGIELGLRRGVRRVLAFALALEIACLAAIALWGAPLLAAGSVGTADHPGWELYLLIGLTAVAMGTQNTSLRMAGILAVFTTHVTGALSQFSEQIIVWLLPRPGAEPGKALAQALLSIGLWLAFFLGALLASMVVGVLGLHTVLAAPIVALAIVVAIDLLSPFANPEAAVSG